MRFLVMIIRTIAIRTLLKGIPIVIKIVSYVNGPFLLMR